MAAFGNKNVRRFDVTVDDALPVRCVQRIDDFNGLLEQLLGIEREAVDDVL